MNNKDCLRIRMSVGDKITQFVCKVFCQTVLILLFVPIAYVLISSVHSRNGWSLDGYIMLMQNKFVLTGLKNSILLAVLGTIYSMIWEIPAAYVLSKKEFGWLTNVFYAVGQFGVALLPLYLMLKQMGLLNSLWGLILPSGLSIYYTQQLRARMINLASELENAAALDGCNPIQYLFYICIPTMAPTIAVFAFFHMCGYWSNTLLAKTILTEESKYPLTLVLNQILIKNQSNAILGASNAASIFTNQMAEYALCVISTLPLIAVFLLIQKHVKAVELDGSIIS